MTNTYLLEVIQALRPEERQEISLFLTSPLYNRGGNAVELAKLYQIIINAAPDFPEHLINKDIVYEQVFPGQAIIQGKLEKHMADLNKLIRNYLLISRNLSESNDIQNQVDWAAWLRERGLGDRARQVFAKLKTQRKNEANSESLDFNRLGLIIAEEEHEWESTYNQAKGDLSIPNLIYWLDLYYHNYRIELKNRYFLQQKLTNLPNLELFDAGVDFYFGESVLLQISRKIYDLLANDSPNIEEFKGLMQFLNQSQNVLTYQSLAQFYAFLRSTCSLLINNGSYNLIPVLHEIHKDNLLRGYFFVNEEVSPNTYVNLVTIAIKADEVNWGKEFTEEYKMRIIGGGNDQFFYSFNMARCLFAEGKFEEALEYLPEAPSNSHFHHMVRRLELQIYYELRSDLLLYKLDAFRKFIERTAPKTIAANLREMDINFLNILLQLSQSPMKDKARSARLVARIEGKKLVADRAWLLEKARELG